MGLGQQVVMTSLFLELLLKGGHFRIHSLISRCFQISNALRVLKDEALVCTLASVAVSM